MAVARTLTARTAAIAAHSVAAAITQVRGAMLGASATTYAHQEAANRDGLGAVGISSAPAPTPSGPVAAIPTQRSPR